MIAVFSPATEQKIKNGEITMYGIANNMYQYQWLMVSLFNGTHLCVAENCSIEGLCGKSEVPILLLSLGFPIF